MKKLIAVKCNLRNIHYCKHPSLYIWEGGRSEAKEIEKILLNIINVTDAHFITLLNVNVIWL